MRRTATLRHYLMCRPTHFDVSYAINPWMDPAVAVDRELAVVQWEQLRATYERLGHRVELIQPLPELPDMVFAANGAFVVAGRVYGSQFRNPERADEAPAYRSWFDGAGYPDVRTPKQVNEGEGDFTVVGGVILAGTGFRTEHAAHLEAQEYFGRPVVSLTLVDPRFYHLDTALFALDDENVAYYPAAFSAGSREVLRRLFPAAVLATEADAVAFGLNSVSDGRNVIIAAAAERLVDALAGGGYQPVPVDLSELLKAGGGAKCCTLELRPGGS
jgi:N-dimethylarginine dimethylaminohydrolase